jgi:ADP-heptose:LPS heptosyltransferase
MALGDVIMTTPIVRGLWQQYRGLCQIDVSTRYPSVYANSPYVTNLSPQGSYDQIYNLDLAYEMKPHQHIITSYVQSVWPQGADIDLFTELWTTSEQAASVNSLNLGTYIVLHLRRDGWPSRNIPLSIWTEIIVRIFETTTLDIVLVGAGEDLVVDFDPRIKNLVGKLSLQELKLVIEGAEVFLGVDSAPMHVALTTTTPTVALFTAALPQYRGAVEANQKFTAINTLAECRGCLHRRPPPVTTYSCEYTEPHCINSWDLDLIETTLQGYTRDQYRI